MSAKKLKSVDEQGEKLDNFITDAVVKISAGVGIGVLASAFFFKRRPWPAILGLGFGLGCAYTNYERALNEPYVNFKVKAMEAESNDH